MQCKMRHSIGVAIVGLLWLPSVAAATVQVSDRLQYDSKDSIVLEYPLESWLCRNGARQAKFDERSTANRKGYVAEWEIKDSKLRLVAFEATLNGRRVSIDEIIPGAKLPVDAVWFCGKLHIPTGLALDGNGSTFASWTKYKRLDVLELKQGAVVGKRVEHNTSLRDLNETEAARAKAN
jgi:hypothetical protein